MIFSIFLCMHFSDRTLSLLVPCLSFLFFFPSQRQLILSMMDGGGMIADSTMKTNIKQCSPCRIN